MSTQNALQILEEATERMREAMKPIPLPQGDMSLNEAYQALALALGKDTFHLSVKVQQFSHRSGPRIKYEIWDGAHHHEGNTLRAVVRDCLTKHAEEPEQTIEDADVLLAEAVLEANPQSDTRPLETAIDAQAAAEF